MLKELFVPNAKPRAHVFLTMVGTQLLFLLLLWLFYPLQMFPTLREVLVSFKNLIVNQGLIQELWASMTTSLGALGIATVLALLISYLTALPFFRPIAYAASKMRYLSLTGLTYFMALMFNSHQAKLAVLVFGATVYLVTGMTSVILNTTQEEMDHARTLGMGEWRSFYEVVVLGKLDEMLEVVRQNFAIIWTLITLVEALNQSEGGIGLLLWKQDRYKHLDGVVAIQLVILIIGALQDSAFGLLKRVFFPYSALTAAK